MAVANETSGGRGAPSVDTTLRKVERPVVDQAMTAALEHAAHLPVSS